MLPLVHMLLKHILPHVNFKTLICHSLTIYPAVTYKAQVNMQQLLDDLSDALMPMPVVLKEFSVMHGRFIPSYWHMHASWLRNSQGGPSTLRTTAAVSEHTTRSASSPLGP